MDASHESAHLCHAEQGRVEPEPVPSPACYALLYFKALVSYQGMMFTMLLFGLSFTASYFRVASRQVQCSSYREHRAGRRVVRQPCLSPFVPILQCARTGCPSVLRPHLSRGVHRRLEQHGSGHKTVLVGLIGLVPAYIASIG
jgi:hypothetical protein